jgi:hypothetical protein
LAGLELHHGGHFLALPDRFAQQVHQLGLGPGAVDGLLDRKDLRVVHGFAQEIEHTLETLEWLVDQHVLPLELVEKGPPGHQLRRVRRLVRRKQQMWRVDQVDQLSQAGRGR